MKFILLTLGLVCGSVYAAHGIDASMPVSNDINVTAPHQEGTWSFGATAVLLQPLNQAFTYVDVQTAVSAGLEESETENYQHVNPGYHGWFGADIGYAFAGKGRDVTLAYEGLHGNDSDHISATDTDTTVLLDIPYFEEYDTAEGKIETRYDAVDLLFGQKLEVGERIGLHPFMGLRYVDINVKNISIYTGPYPDIDDATTVEQATWNSHFQGIGPRFGSDAEINLGQGFSVRARLGLSALMGSSKPDFNSILQAYDDEGAAVYTYTNEGSQGANTHLIPEIDGRLGLNYTYPFDSRTALGIEAGWQAVNYFNATYQLLGYDSLDNTAVTSANFGLQGPYARLQLDLA